MSPRFLIAVAATCLAATTAQADEPGPGGTRAPTPTTGEAIYRTMCQACHMVGGKGAPGAFPALANNPRLGTAAYPIVLIQRGKGAMPAFKDMLTPAQVATVVGYLRTHFGNSYTDPVTAADAAALR